MANKVRGPSELALPTYFPIKARIKSGVTSNQIDYYMGKFGSTAERSIYLDKLNYVQMTDVPHVHLPPNTLAATRFERSPTDSLVKNVGYQRLYIQHDTISFLA